MKAVIIVGGSDLTPAMPKPLVEFANKPMVLHQIEALKAAGVTEVVLVLNSQPEVVLNFLKGSEETLKMKITCFLENEPLGTLALVRDRLIDDIDNPFFVINDVICEFPFKKMIEFHKSHGGEASIMVTKVDEPSKHDIVVVEESSGQVHWFVEKPTLFVGNTINAGIYLLNPSVLDRIQLRPTSFEKEVLPEIARERKLYAMVLQGFWLNIGQPRDYITGLRLYLDALKMKLSPRLAFGGHIRGNVLVDESAQIGERCLIGPNVAIGPGCVIEPSVRLLNCIVMSGTRIGEHAHISNSILCCRSDIEECVRFQQKLIFGEDVHIPGGFALGE